MKNKCLPQLPKLTVLHVQQNCTSKTRGESMGSKINTYNLFHILHHFWIAVKMICTSKNGNEALYKVSSSLTSHIGGEVSYFILSAPLWSTITQRKVIESSCPLNRHIYKSSRRRSEPLTSYFTPSTPMDPPQFRKISGSSHFGSTNIYN
jgi:hypothetical protein